MRNVPAAVLVILGVLLTADPLCAQNLITQGGWEGFAMRTPDGKFDRCILYNRTIQALNSSPYEMLGISRDASGGVGLIAFYRPRALTRDARTPVAVKLGARPPVTLAGTVMSDFHVVVPGPLDAGVTAALREAPTIEITTESKTLAVPVAGVAAVLDRLDECVRTHAR